MLIITINSSHMDLLSIKQCDYRVIGKNHEIWSKKVWLSLYKGQKQDFRLTFRKKISIREHVDRPN